jgi:beta-glucosidase
MKTVKFTTMIKSTMLFMFALLTLNSDLFSQNKELLPYKNVKLNSSERAKDLLSRLNIEEKTCQLMAVWDGIPFPYDTNFLKDTVKLRSVFGNGVNSVQPSFTDLKTTVETRNTIQKYLLEKTKWGIPALFVDEGQHGLMRPEATSFPQAIGLACSWDPELFQKVYTTIAHEMRSRGTHHVLSPVIDVCRDPRWGRVEETYGEDPYLNGILGIAAVRGFQGTSTGQIGTENVAATLKHLAGHGQPEGGINQAPANYSLRVLREFHLLPFKMTIDGAHPVAVMPSYNEIDGVPSHINKWLFQDILRKEWGYKGMVVSDYFGIDQLFEKQSVAASKEDAAEKAFNAGVQYEFPMSNYYHALPALVKNRKINIAEIDSAVFKILELKFALGLFDNPYVDFKKAEVVSKSETSAALALKAAQEAIVLLKNEGNLLPLSTEKYKKIAVVGPCAKDVYFGGYAGEPYKKVSLLEGIKAKVNGKAEVIFAQGCKLTTNSTISFYNWKRDPIEFASREENLKLIAEAVETAKIADVIILAIGENDQLCREAWAKNHIGDNLTLDLFGQQEELVNAMVALGKPVVVYLMNGRPLSINSVVKTVPAIIEGWYMGQATGTAAAGIIFGDVNPSGKLTITFPKSAGQLPMYYNHKPSAQYHDYISGDVKPLFPFGYGLSYTTFAYGNPRLSNTTIKTDGKVKVAVDVTNSGKMKGDDIVQLYIRDKVSSVTRPVKELKDFKRISLEPGQTKTIDFTIDKSKLSFWDIDMNYSVEPGEFDIMVGNSSENLQTVTLIVE